MKIRHAPIFCNLEAELKRKNINRKMLSELLNCSISTISNKLTGQSNLDLEEAETIKKFLDCNQSIEYLFDRSVAKRST